MILFEIFGNENHALYQFLAVQNGSRQYDFLRSIVTVAVAADKAFLSQQVIKALNYQAITCLHTNAGEFRPCVVEIKSGDVVEFRTPAPHQVQALMDDLVNYVNRIWETADPVVLAAFVLWRLNVIHPFINGNGRTARATAYFVLCVKFGGLLPGTKTLPELISRERPRYVDALRQADQSAKSGQLDLSALHALLVELLEEQLRSATAQGTGEPSQESESGPLLLPPPTEFS